MVCVAKTKQNKKPRGFVGRPTRLRKQIGGWDCAVSLSRRLRCYLPLPFAGAQSRSQTDRGKLMAPSLRRGSECAGPLPTGNLPVAVLGGRVLPGEGDRAQSLGSPRLQHRPGAVPRSRAIPGLRALLPAAPQHCWERPGSRVPAQQPNYVRNGGLLTRKTPRSTLNRWRQQMWAL